MFEKNDNSLNFDMELSHTDGGIIVIGVVAYYLHTTYDFELKFDMTDNYQTYGTKKTFSLFERRMHLLNTTLKLTMI